MPRTANAILQARVSGVGQVGGETLSIRAGDLIEADHPIVKKHPDWFGPIKLPYPIRAVEQATAAPGEKR